MSWASLGSSMVTGGEVCVPLACPTVVQARLSDELRLSTASTWNL